jgi:D-alanine transaminase
VISNRLNLLAQVLAKKQAYDAGAEEALMIDHEGYVTECGSTSFFIVKDNLLLTRPLTNDILPGVTRRAVVALCQTHELSLAERKFTLDEALNADEAFITAASSYVLPVVKIDNREISGGKPGDIYRRLREFYLQYARATLI